MPLRSDPTLWFNLAGIVAAYQPVMAPGPLLARYNQAHGGDNRYRAEPGVLPAWSATAGWICDTSTVLGISALPLGTQNQAAAVRVSGSVYNVGYNPLLMGMYDAGNRQFGLSPSVSGTTLSVYRNGGQVTYSNRITSGIMAVSGSAGYLNGVLVASSLPTWGGNPTSTLSVCAAYAGRLQCAAYWSRSLSVSELWSVSRQMAYCNVNPDWSAWGRRRRWYYGPQVAAAGRVGVYGARPTIALPGGVRIAPMSEGGVDG